MTQPALFPFYAEAFHYSFKHLLVAYDFSEAADTSLKYAAMLSRYFASSIHLVSVQTPAEYAGAVAAGPRATQMSQRNHQFELCRIQERLRGEGIENDAIIRVGKVSDVLEGVMLERAPDLLLLGAFGYSAKDRPRLGSTAERLLRTVRRPILTVGPHALLREREAPPLQRILCATSSRQSTDDVIFFAGRFAARVRAHLSLAHAVDPNHRDLPRRGHEQRCEEWGRRLREQEIAASWTLLYGAPEEEIQARAAEEKSSLIMFGLHRKGEEMVDCPEGVVSATIHRAHCPVMTIPFGLPL